MTGDRDDRIVRLLEEIRDLQRRHVDSYGDALRNQQESIRLQQEWHRMAAPRYRLVVFAVAVVVFVLLLLVFRIAGPFFR
jgi:hypothetical protein